MIRKYDLDLINAKLEQIHKLKDVYKMKFFSVFKNDNKTKNDLILVFFSKEKNLKNVKEFYCRAANKYIMCTGTGESDDDYYYFLFSVNECNYITEEEYELKYAQGKCSLFRYDYYSLTDVPEPVIWLNFLDQHFTRFTENKNTKKNYLII